MSSPGILSCAFVRADGSLCGRSALGTSSLCIFHTPPTSVPSGHEALFSAAFTNLINTSDGDWEGFIFPGPTKIAGRTVSFDVSLSGAQLGALELSDVTFEKAFKATGCQFEGPVTINRSKFHGGVWLDRCRFKQDCEVQHTFFLNTCSFASSNFAERAYLLAVFRGNTSFREARFCSSLHFSGWRNITVNIREGIALAASIGGSVSGAKANSLAYWIDLVRRRAEASIASAKSWARRRMRAVRRGAEQKLHQIKVRFSRTDDDTTFYLVFEGETDLEFVEFQKPSQVSFVQVDLSKARLRGTSLKGVRLQDIRFWQDSLKRDGLFDEVDARRSRNGPHFVSMLPHLEDAYRSVRAALEENRDFSGASDFYVGEMEARRQQRNLLGRHLLSVEAWYRALSRYGTSVGVSAALLLGFVMLHSELTLLIAHWAGDILTLESLGEATLRAARQALFQQAPNGDLKAAQSWVDLAFRGLVAVQLTLLVFAFRGRIKRS